MNSDEVESGQINVQENDSFCILSREYLPKERLLTHTWNNEVRIRIQYEFTNLLPILFLSENVELVKQSRSKLQKIVFELLTSVLFYLDIPCITAIEFLENCSIVSYLKVCKILSYNFTGKSDLDIQEIPTDSIKDEFKDFISDPSKAIEDKLPSFKCFVEDHITPLIMDALWLIQMSVNDNEPNKSSIWMDFMTRLCRGNITSKERPLPSIPKSVKLISIRDVVSYLDLGKSDNMSITESLISSKFKLQQKYVRDRTRQCFTVDSFTTQKECLNGFSILGVLIKYFFDQAHSYSELSVGQSTSGSISNTSHFSELKGEDSENNPTGIVTDTSENYAKTFLSDDLTRSIWDVIVRYDLSIQRSIGLVFEAFVSTISSCFNTNKNSKVPDIQLFTILERLLIIFPRNSVNKSFIIFVEHVSDVLRSYKESKLSNSTNTITIGGNIYKSDPWIIIDKKGFKDVLGLPFFILTSFLINKGFFELNNYFKEKLIEWDDIFWSELVAWKNLTKEMKDSTSNADYQNFFLPPKTLEIIDRIYKYYHLCFNSQINAVNEFERDLNLESLLKEILRNERINDEVNFSNISVILSELILSPSVLFAHAFFACDFTEESMTNEDAEDYYVSRISKNSEFIQELTDILGMPFSIINLSSNILKLKIEVAIKDITIKVREDTNAPHLLILHYKRFYLLSEWIGKYCKHYLFQKYPSCIPILLELLGIFIEDYNRGKLSELFVSKEPNSINDFKDPPELLYDISSCIVFPAISLLPKSPSVPDMLKSSIFDQININHRYQIYRRLMTFSYNKYPMNYQWITVRKTLSKYLKGVTKDIMNNKSDNKNSNKKRPPIQIRLLTSNIIGLCYTNPLVVCDTIINQCNNYDNMIPLLIEILGNNIDEICFDVMIFTIINFILSRPAHDVDCRSKNTDVNCSRFGNRGIAKFAALLLTKRKVPGEILRTFLQTIIYRIDETLHGKEYTTRIPNNFLDLCFWKQLLETVLLTPVLDLSVLTGKQIQSLAGGPLLFQLLISQHEEVNFDVTNDKSFFNHLLDNKSYAKQNYDMFLYILKSGVIQGKEVFFRIAKLRSEILWDAPSNLNMDIKLLTNLSDEIHWCCIQTIELLKRSFDPQSYKNFILNISNTKCGYEDVLIQTFLYLDTPTGWSFLRYGIRKPIITQTNKEDLMIQGEFLDIDNEAMKCIKSYILKENNKDFFNNEVCMDFYVMFWYLDLCDISLPYQHYSEKLFELYTEILDCKENINKILVQKNYKYKIKTILEKRKLEYFLDPNNVKQLPRSIKDHIHVSRHVKDEIQPYEKKLRKLYSCYNALAIEYIKQYKRIEFITKYIHSDRGIRRFREEIEGYSTENADFDCSKNRIHSFMIWICKDFIAQRVIHSETDALFTYLWVEKFILDEEKGIFSTNKCLIESFIILLTKHVSSLIRSSTPRESQLLGLFFNEIFSFIKRFVFEIRPNICLNINNQKRVSVVSQNITATDLAESGFITEIEKNTNHNLETMGDLVIEDEKQSKMAVKINFDSLEQLEKKDSEVNDKKVSLNEETLKNASYGSFPDELNKVEVSRKADENKTELNENIKGKSENEEASPQKTLEPGLRFLYECEKNIMVSLSLGLGLISEKSSEACPEWIDTLSSVWMLSRLYESFPISALTGEYLLKELPNILEYATNKHWNDLNLSITSLILKLKQHRVNWIGNRNENDCSKQNRNVVHQSKILNESSKRSISNASSPRPTNHSTSRSYNDKTRSNLTRPEYKRQRLNINDGEYSYKTGYSNYTHSNRREYRKKHA